MPFPRARLSIALAALVTVSAPAMADEVWSTSRGDMQWETTLGEIAVFNLYGDGVAPSEFRLFLHGLGSDVMGGRGNYLGYWTSESGVRSCSASLTDPMGTTTYDWGTVELAFDRPEFPSGWSAQIGYCVDPREEAVRGVAPAAGAVK